jgi:hypothetical protein
MKAFNRVVLSCDAYPDGCDGGVSCWADFVPSWKKQCSRCDCAYCKHGKCEGKKKVEEANK